jgi:ectoine hydroxylase-related dioxygenase (phytanoyl-CoA dioxygenase family)
MRTSLRSNLRWIFEFTLYVLKYSLKDPKFLFHNLYSILIGEFLPSKFTLDCPSPITIFNSDDPEAAANYFHKHGFVVVKEALSAQEVDKLKTLAETQANKMKELSAKELGAGNKSDPARYSYGDYKNQPDWDYLAPNPAIIAILRAIWKDKKFFAVLAGGDVCFPGARYQDIHNDFSWAGAGGDCLSICVNYYTIDVKNENGPIRFIPNTFRFPPPSPWLVKHEPKWMKEFTIEAPAGTAVIRDFRAWHGGTPNRSQIMRAMPNCEYILKDAKACDIGGYTLSQRLKSGSFLAEF